MSKAVKTKVIYDSSTMEPSDSHFTKGGSLRSSSRIRKRIVLGEKFDYGEKAKEKQNYILYISGQGQEKTEIEEMEEIYGGTKKKEKIIEEKQLIDNYQYHETKDIRKKNPKNCQTVHERLCSPFERTKLKKYSSYTSEPKKSGFKVIKTTDLVNKNDYSRNLKPHNKFNFYKYNSNTTEIKRDHSNSKVYETYKPYSRKKSIDITTYRVPPRPKMTTTKVRNVSLNSIQGQFKVNGQKNIDHLQVNYTKTRQNNIPQNAISYEIQNDFPEYKSHKQLGLDNTKTNLPITVNRIKYGKQLKGEKKLFEGPKIQYIGSELPRAGKSRSRPNSRTQRPQKLIKQKKGYVPFAGHGMRVGNSQFERKIPRPTPRLSKGNLNLSNISQISRNNVRNINDIGKENVQVNRTFAHFSNNQINKNFRKNPKIFPGKGIRVGGSGLNEKIGISSDYGSSVFHTDYSIFNKKKPNYLNEESYEQSLCYFGED